MPPRDEADALALVAERLAGAGIDEGGEAATVEDTAPAMTRVGLRVRYEIGSRSFDKLLQANVIYEDATGGALVRGLNAGSWGVHETSALREDDFTTEPGGTA